MPVLYGWTDLVAAGDANGNGNGHTASGEVVGAEPGGDLVG